MSILHNASTAVSFIYVELLRFLATVPVPWADSAIYGCPDSVCVAVWSQRVKQQKQCRTGIIDRSDQLIIQHIVWAVLLTDETEARPPTSHTRQACAVRMPLRFQLLVYITYRPGLELRCLMNAARTCRCAVNWLHYVDCLSVVGSACFTYRHRLGSSLVLRSLVCLPHFNHFTAELWCSNNLV